MPRIPTSNPNQVSVRVQQSRTATGSNPVYDQMNRLGNRGMDLAANMMKKEKVAADNIYVNKSSTEADVFYSNLESNIKNTDPTSVNYVEEFDKKSNEFQQQLLDRAPSSEARMYLQNKLSSANGALRLKLDTVQKQKKQEALVGTLEDAVKTSIMGVRSASSPSYTKQKMVDVVEMYENATGFLDEDARTKAKEHALNNLAYQSIAGHIEKEDYATAEREMINSQAIRDNLNLGQISRLQGAIAGGIEAKNRKEATVLKTDTFKTLKYLQSPENDTPISKQDMDSIQNNIRGVLNNKYISDAEKDVIVTNSAVALSLQQFKEEFYDSRGEYRLAEEDVDAVAETYSEQYRSVFNLEIGKDQIKRGIIAAANDFQAQVMKEPVKYANKLNPEIASIADEIRVNKKQALESNVPINQDRMSQYKEALKEQYDKMRIPTTSRTYLLPEDNKYYTNALKAAEKSKDSAHVMSVVRDMRQTYGAMGAAANLDALGYAKYAMVNFLSDDASMNLAAEVMTKEGKDRTNELLIASGIKTKPEDILNRLKPEVLDKSAVLKGLLGIKLGSETSTVDVQKQMIEMTEMVSQMALREYAELGDEELAVEKVLENFSGKSPNDPIRIVSDGSSTLIIPNDDSYETKAVSQYFSRYTDEASIFGRREKFRDFVNEFDPVVPDIYEGVFNDRLNDTGMWVNSPNEGYARFVYRDASGKKLLNGKDGKPIEVSIKDIRENGAAYEKYKANTKSKELKISPNARLNRWY